MFDLKILDSESQKEKIFNEAKKNRIHNVLFPSGNKIVNYEILHSKLYTKDSLKNAN